MRNLLLLLLLLGLGVQKLDPVHVCYSYQSPLQLLRIEVHKITSPQSAHLPYYDQFMHGGAEDAISQCAAVSSK